MSTALVLEMLSESDNKLFSEHIAQLPQTFQYKTNFACPSRDTMKRIIKICIEHGSPRKIETLDGAKIWIDEETWLMVRPSGTEPLIRMYAESTDKSLLDSKVDEYSRLVQSQM
jgi:phosphomannomutase / phosphoglucomutase